MHSGYVESECCHFLFYGMIGMEVDCCICAGRLSIHVHFKLFVFMCYYKVKKSMDLCCSYVGLSVMLLCILFMYVLMVCDLILVVSYMIKISSMYLV